jgi:hypothetical protein
VVDALTLATARAVVQTAMLDTITLGSVTSTLDRYGTITEVFVAGASVAAQLRSPSVAEQRLVEDFRNSGILGTETIAITVPHGTALGERVRTSDSRVWRVVWTGVTPGLSVQVDALITLEVMR